MAESKVRMGLDHDLPQDVLGDLETVFWGGIHFRRSAETDSLFLKGGCIAIGLPEVGDLSALPDDLGAFKAKVAQAYPKKKPHVISLDAVSLYRFVRVMKPGQFVIYPPKTSSFIHLGRIEGDYEYQEAKDPAHPHRRPVKWLKTIPQAKCSLWALHEIGLPAAPFPVRSYAEDFRTALRGREHSPGLSEDEWRVVRLFRCMTVHERHETLLQVAGTLMRRYSVDPGLYWYSSVEETLKEELSPENVEDFDGRLMGAWPGGWPGRTCVELDDTGDPGYFLEQALAEGASYHLLGTSENDKDTAEMLAWAYREAVIEHGYPLPSEYGDAEDEEVKEDEDLEVFRKDFLGFVQTWREQVVAIIERQAREGT